MATVYEVLRNGETSGPFTGVELKKLVDDGKLTRNDKIRPAGRADWHPAGLFASLFPPPGPSTEAAPPAPAPAPPSAAVAAPPPAEPAAVSSLRVLPEAPATSAAGPGPGATPPAEGHRPPFAHLTLAAIGGVALATGLSFLKPSLGAAGLFGVVLGLAAALGLALFLMRSSVAPLVAQLGPDNPAVASARRRAGRLGWLGAAALLPAGLASAAEFATPRDGLSRTVLASFAPKPPEPPAPPPEPAFDAKPWVGATFVLVEPGANAVAVRHDPGASAFHAVAFAEKAEARKAMRAAVNGGVQLIDENPDLAGRVAALGEPGRIPGRLEGEIGEIWRVHQYLPADASLVTFRDVREGKARVGFAVDRKPDEVAFVPLVPKRAGKGEGNQGFQSEVVRRADVRTGSQRVGLTDAQLRGVTDFLDYGVYRILEKLSATQRGAGYVRVVVEPVTFDDTKLKGIKEQAATLSDRYLKELEIKARNNITDDRTKARLKGAVNKQRDRQYANTTVRDRAELTDSASRGSLARGYGGAGFAGQGRQATLENEVTTSRGAEAEDTRTDFEEDLTVIRNRSIRGDAEAKKFMQKYDVEERRLREIEAETSKVTAELRTRLNDAGVSVLEKSRIDALLAERELTADGGSGSGPKPDERFLGATHVMIAELSDRRGNDQYHLSIRLVKVGTREIVAEVECERTPPRAVDDTPPADVPYLLQTGQLVVVEFNDDVRPRTDQGYLAYPGGYPVDLPFLGLVAMTQDDRDLETRRDRTARMRGSPRPGGGIFTENPPILAGMHTRLGFLDDPGTPDVGQSPYRRLVGMALDDASRKDLPFDKVPFRDLFSDETVQIDVAKIKNVREANDSNVPEAHQMRYVTYQIASSMLPSAGRITTAGENDMQTVALGHGNGLRVSDRLRVLRPGASDRLDFELSVREVQDAFARVSYDRNEALFADRYGPKAGDLVHRRPDKAVTLAILPFKADDGRENAANPGMNGGGGAMGGPRGRAPLVSPFRPGPQTKKAQPKAKEALRDFNNTVKSLDYVRKAGNELQGKIREALQGRYRVPLAEPNNATHVLEGRVTFATDFKDYSIPAHIRVTERATGKIVHEQDFHFSEREGQSWKP